MDRHSHGVVTCFCENALINVLAELYNLQSKAYILVKLVNFTSRSIHSLKDKVYYEQKSVFS